MDTRFDFLKPEVLFLLGSLAVLYLFLAHSRSSKILRLRAFGVTSQVSAFICVGMPLVITALLVLAVSRPYWGAETVRVSAQGQDIIVVIDISNSMLAEDVAPSRLEFAKRKLLDMIEYLAKESPGDRVGLVPFAGDSYLFCPLTADYAVLRVFIRALSTTLISSGGSAISAALERALGSFRAAQVNHPRLLLVSDGEDMNLDVDKIISTLREASVPVDVMGFGTEEGAPIRLREGRFVKNEGGDLVVSKRDEKSLKRIAYESGGGFFEPRLDDSDIRAIFRSNRLAGGASDLSREEEVTIYNELGPFILLAALLLLLGAWLYRSEGVIFLWLSLMPLMTQSAVHAAAPSEETQNNEKQLKESKLPPRQAAEIYRAGKYDEALSAFEYHHEKSPKDRKIAQGLASAQYKTGNYSAAAKLFEELAQNAGNGRHKFEALYNLGNSRFMSGDYGAAISGYEKALELKPDDKRTKFNLNLARRLLEEKKEKEQSQSKDQEQRNSQENQAEQDQQASSDQGSKDTKGEDSPPAGDEKSAESDKTEQDSKAGEQGDGQKEEEKDSTESGAEAESQKGQMPEEQSTAGSEGQDNSPQGSHSAHTAQSEEEIKEGEARAWLESLPDNPVLFQRKPNKNNQSKQTW